MSSCALSPLSLVEPNQKCDPERVLRSFARSLTKPSLQYKVQACLIKFNQAMKTYGGGGDGIPKRINLGTRWRCVISLTLRPQPSGKRAFGSHWIGEWVNTGYGSWWRRGGHFLPLRDSNPGRTARDNTEIPRLTKAHTHLTTTENWYF
jgi:hypothetical protein